MEIRAFGIVKEIAGTATITVDSINNVAALKASLAAQYPLLSQLSSFMIAVNGEYANDETTIQDGDEVAVIPPVSGG